jgi:hypothetical protein
MVGIAEIDRIAQFAARVAHQVEKADIGSVPRRELRHRAREAAVFDRAHLARFEIKGRRLHEKHDDALPDKFLNERVERCPGKLAATNPALAARLGLQHDGLDPRNARDAYLCRFGRIRQFAAVCIEAPQSRFVRRARKGRHAIFPCRPARKPLVRTVEPGPLRLPEEAAHPQLQHLPHARLAQIDEDRLRDEAGHECADDAFALVEAGKQGGNGIDERAFERREHAVVGQMRQTIARRGDQVCGRFALAPIAFVEIARRDAEDDGPRQRRIEAYEIEGRIVERRKSAGIGKRAHAKLRCPCVGCSRADSLWRKSRAHARISEYQHVARRRLCQREARREAGGEIELRRRNERLVAQRQDVAGSDRGKNARNQQQAALCPWLSIPGVEALHRTLPRTGNR